MILFYLLCIFAAGQGLFQILIMATGAKNKFKEQIILGFILGILSLSIIEYTLVFSGQIGHIPHLIGFSTLFQFMLCPLIYFFLKWSKEEKIENIFLHFIPSLIVLLTLSDFILSSGQYKVENFSSIYASKIMIGQISFPLFLLFFFQCIYYAFKLLSGYSNRIDPMAQIIYRFFKLYLFVHIFHTCLISFMPSLLPYVGVGILILSVFTIYAMAFHSFKRGQHKSTLKKYAHSNLTSGQAKAIITELDAFLEKDDYFANADIRLKSLAQKLGMPSQHLSQAINEILGMHFKEYLNAKRIAFAEDLILNSITGKISLKEVSYSSGYNNKTSFSNAFKKVKGMPPSEYVSKLKSKLRVETP